MMGMSFLQRSNLTVNHGHYYIDTTVSKKAQKDGLLLAPLQIPSYNVFRKNQTYYVFLLYATADTKQRYQMYVGPNFDTKTHFHWVRANIANKPLQFPDDSTITAEPGYDGNILTVDIDLTALKTEIDTVRTNSCQPKSFCELKGNKCQCSATLQKDNPELFQECQKDNDKICQWAGKDVDCPEKGCVGFRVTFPTEVADDQDHRPTADCFPKKVCQLKQTQSCTTDNDCTNNTGPCISSVWDVAFTRASETVAGTCSTTPIKPTAFCQ